MPAQVFRGLWDDCRQRKKWHGYVKNLRKDSAFYWAYATVVPNVRNGMVVGYTSVRRKPSRTQINQLLPVYRQWLKEEEAQKALPQQQSGATAWEPTVFSKGKGVR